MIAGSIGLSQALDKRFGRTTAGAKMTDVPGHTRGLISPLAAHGVKFLDIGVNGGCTPAEVPPLFLWKDSNGSSLVVMYHLGYGGTVVVPGSDLAVVIEVANDNAGPHSPDEIVRIYSELGHRFPNADIHAASLTEIANAVEPYRNQLPILTQEIGDTWTYGVSSDPLKVARYREVARLRNSWIGTEKIPHRRRNRRCPSAFRCPGGRTHLGHGYKNLARLRPSNPAGFGESARHQELSGRRV